MLPTMCSDFTPRCFLASKGLKRPPPWRLSPKVNNLLRYYQGIYQPTISKMEGYSGKIPDRDCECRKLLEEE